MSYRDFAQVGRLGCSQCYDVFASNLVPLVKRIHGSDRHIGKTPAATNEGVQLRKELDELKNKLAQAVLAEEYEKAAELRDHIKALEAEIRGEHD
jgi:protein arginine kinase activator